MNIITVNISGVTEVNFPEFNKYIWIRNKNDSSIYASLSSDVADGVDGTTEIPSKESGMLLMTDDRTIYISGSGTAEIKASDFAECPFKLFSKGGGSGGTSDYTELTNKPSINHVTLAGDKSFEDLGLDLSGYLSADNVVNNCTQEEITASINRIWG